MTVQIIEVKLPNESQRGQDTATRVQIIEAKLPGKSDLRTKTLRGYVMEWQGRLIAVLEKDSPAKQKNSFQVKFTMLPTHWTLALRQIGSARAWDLATAILDESFRLKRFGGGKKITLSGKVTNMPYSTRIWAAEKLEQCGLIKILREGDGKALRIIPL
jgi:hypothetical protein